MYSLDILHTALQSLLQAQYLALHFGFIGHLLVFALGHGPCWHSCMYSYERMNKLGTKQPTLINGRQKSVVTHTCQRHSRIDLHTHSGPVSVSLSLCCTVITQKCTLSTLLASFYEFIIISKEKFDERIQKEGSLWQLTKLYLRVRTHKHLVILISSTCLIPFTVILLLPKLFLDIICLLSAALLYLQQRFFPPNFSLSQEMNILLISVFQHTMCIFPAFKLIQNRINSSGINFSDSTKPLAPLKYCLNKII